MERTRDNAEYPVEVNPTPQDVNLDHLRGQLEMLTWNRRQRRNFIRSVGGFKKRGKKW